MIVMNNLKEFIGNLNNLYDYGEIDEYTLFAYLIDLNFLIDKEGKYIRRERYAGACQRSYYVGEDITEEDIKAEFKHGILKLFVPKKEAKPAVEEKKYISIQ